MRSSLVCIWLLASSLAAQQAPYGKPTGPKSAPVRPQPAACLWLTEGSAAEYLRGDVTLKLSAPDSPKRSCRFTQKQSQDSLEIVVSKDALVTCKAGSTALRGIGNQAAMCMASAHSKMVSGRVRDSFFTVTHSSRVAQASSEQDDALAQIAEQVAGNLF